MSRVGFLFKAGRTERLQIDCPTEFFYGMPELAAAGWDIGVITDDELGLSSAPRSRLWRTLSQISHAVLGLSAWVVHVLGQSRHVKRLNGFDVLVATTNSYGVALGVLKRKGLLRPRVVFLAMGLVDRNASVLRRAAYRWALRDIDVYALADADSHVMQSVLRQPIGSFRFGVDTKFWRPTDAQNPREDFVLSIGNDRFRDFDLLIRGWKPEYPLLKLVTKLPVESHAANVRIIHGDWHAQALSDAEIRELYQQARFVVLPIRHTYQPSGQSACLQAMACGCAVAITDFPGLWSRESMIDGDTCVLMGPPGSIEGIHTGVERLLHSPTLAEDIGVKARRLVGEKFHVGAMANAMALALSGR